MTRTITPIELTSEALAARIDALIATERLSTLELLAHLAELDRRKLYVTLGFGSFFAYCTGHLRLTNGAAFRRTTAARLLTRFPAVAPYLADGRLGLTTLCLLKDVLTEATHAEILARAAGLTEDHVKR